MRKNKNPPKERTKLRISFSLSSAPALRVPQSPPPPPLPPQTLLSILLTMLLPIPAFVTAVGRSRCRPLHTRSCSLAAAPMLLIWWNTLAAFCIAGMARARGWNFLWAQDYRSWKHTKNGRWAFWKIGQKGNTDKRNLTESESGNRRRRNERTKITASLETKVTYKSMDD